MSPMDPLRDMLIRHEGVRLKPYRCSAGKLTIGVGRCLDSIGISELEAMLLLSNDINRVTKETIDALSWFKSINAIRQDVILSMIFNLGLTRFLGFRKMIEAVRLGNYELASQEMLTSKWAGQVGLRARELAEMMRTGHYSTRGVS